jgi:TolA-binding protein
MFISLRKGAFAFFTFCSIFFYAQKTAIYTDADALYKQGVSLFDKQQFVSSQKSFNEFILTSRPGLLQTDALFYESASAIELFNKDGEWGMKNFIKKFPESNKINLAYFYLAKSSFRKKKYSETIEYFEKVDIYDLDKPQLAELYFKRGYSYIEVGNDSKAKGDFFEIKDVDNKYSFPANYYYSHLAYKEKNYETALTGFKRLVGNETFGSVVPYYITQMYFIQGTYDKVIVEAPPLLKDSANIQKESEINRMVGESYFNLKDYANALTWLKKTELGSGLNPQGNYALGYCYYKINDCANAVNNFEKVTTAIDTLAQSAWYHMGNCYVKLEDKLKAKNAYYSAYKLNVDKKITEDALFSFAKLSYELDFSPYNEAVKAFQKYLKEYPKSPRTEECYNYLVNVYSTTKNYELAINSMESLETIDPIIKGTYQKLIYFKAVEHFNNSDLDNAEKQFKKSLQQNSDLKLNALNQYWLAEIYYLRKDYTTAVDAWKKFQLFEGAVQLKEYDLSNYAIAYAYFQRKEKDDFTEANISFRKFLLTKNKYDDNKLADANIRAADCYFMNRDFLQASDYYKTAIALNKIDVDYSLYQKALCDGLNKNYKEKISELTKIETRFPSSNYLSASINQIADTYYKNLKDEDNAIIYYNKIIKNYPNSSFASNSYAQLGNIYYGRKQDDKAFDYYDKFVKLDNTSEEAKDVLDAIKKIFEAKGKVDEMEKYFASVGNPLSENQIEKSLYTAAYDAYYTQKNCDLAMPKWESYIAKFPNGKYINEAYFNLAECTYSKNLFEKSLIGYQYIILKPRSIYTEVSLAKTAYLFFKDKKYAEALPLFQQLQEVAETPANKSSGRFGAMRSAFYLNSYEVALTECTKVISTEKLTPQQTSEAKYIKAKSLYETNRLDDALIEFKAITKSAKNVTGAEAYYLIGKIQFLRGNFKDVETTILKLMGYEYSNDDWNNKGMFLMAEAYLAKGDVADAKVTLQTVIDSKPKPDVLAEFQMKLDEINVQQALDEKKALENSGSNMKVDFNQTKSDEDLFDKMYEESLNKSEGANSNSKTPQPK